MGSQVYAVGQDGSRGAGDSEGNQGFDRMIQIGQINDSYNASVVRCLIQTLTAQWKRATGPKHRERLARKIRHLQVVLVHYTLTCD